MITTFGGGVGAGKFLDGLHTSLKNNSLNLNIVVNTADDIDIFGVRVSPDIDSILYRLSGISDKNRGWGIKGDTYKFLNSQPKENRWFNLGDKDLERNLIKQALVDKGFSLQKVVEKQSKKLGIKKTKIIPMTNDIVETYIVSNGKKMHFQEFLIKYKMRPKVDKILFKNIKQSKPSVGLIEQILNSKILIFCPSNPIISINPILTVPGIKNAIVASNAMKIAISPIVNDKAFQGPVLKLMQVKKLKPTVVGVAEFYKGIVNYLMIDEFDKKYIGKISETGIKPIVRNIKMRNKTISKAMSKSILDLIE
tara:strand:- start:2800 stop:3726 length:927 start_codon:yes stop_codon:yes gene_type:complete